MLTKLELQSHVVQYKQAMRRLFVLLDASPSNHDAVIANINRLNLEFADLQRSSSVPTDMSVVRDSLPILADEVEILGLLNIAKKNQNVDVLKQAQLIAQRADMHTDIQIVPYIQSAFSSSDNIDVAQRQTHAVLKKALDGIRHIASEQEHNDDIYTSRDFLNKVMTILENITLPTYNVDNYENDVKVLRELDIRPPMSEKGIDPMISPTQLQQTLPPPTLPPPPSALPPPPPTLPLPPALPTVPSTQHQPVSTKDLLSEIQSKRIDVSPQCASFKTTYYQQQCQALGCPQNPKNCVNLKAEYKKFTEFDCSTYDAQKCANRRCTNLTSCEQELKPFLKPQYRPITDIPNMSSRKPQLTRWLQEADVSNQLLDMLHFDNNLQTPKTLGDIGNYVNRLAATLAQLRIWLQSSSKPAVIASIADVWAAVIYDYMNEINQMCDAQCFLSLESCDGECATLYKQRKSLAEVTQLELTNRRKAIEEEEEENHEEEFE